MVKICFVTVYDFYQFEVDYKSRLTDREWKTIMGFEIYNSWNDSASDSPDKSILEPIKESLKFQEWTNIYKTDEYITNISGS